MSHIQKTEYGTYRAFGRDAAGKKVAKTHKRKKDAQEWLDELTGKVRAGEYVDPEKGGRTTFGAYVEDFYRRQFELRDSTRKMDGDVLAHLLPAFESTPLANITAEELTDFYAEKIDNGLSPSYVHRMHKVASKILTDAVDRRMLVRNPASLKACKPPKPGKAQMEILLPPMIKALSEAINPRYAAWVYVMSYSGLRWGEGAGLRVMDLDDRVITVSEQLQYKDGEHHRGPLKTAASARSIALPRAVAEKLRDHLSSYTDLSPGAYMFTSQRGTPLVHASFTNNNFKPALRRAGLSPTIRIHDLRHTSVALAIAAGGHPSAIQARLGHDSIKTTLDTYGHLFPGLDESLADDMDVE